ncbi:hypothetical protein [Plantactinospora sp. B5E13]|uniref:hypothetical protein n=1 Tax=unclassified Plantactinospora TaxID=2631981 RepID=UPI00325CA9D9
MDDNRIVVIDLGTDRYEPPSAPPAGWPRRSTVRRLRPVVAAAAAALAFGVGGAAAPPAPPLRAILSLPLASEPNGGFYLLGDVLVVAERVESVAEPQVRLTGYELTRGRQLWSIGRPVAITEFRFTPAENRLLLSEGGRRGGPIHTRALDPRTGELRWSYPSKLEVMPGERQTALIFEEIFPAGSLVDPQARPTDSTTWYHSNAGGIYREPPLGVVLHGINLDTGEPRWTSPRMTRAVTLAGTADRPAAVLTVPSEGGIEVRDPHTGAVRHRLDGFDGELVAAHPIGDVVVLVWAEPAGAAGYSSDRWQLRWSRSQAGPDFYVEPCGPMLCRPGFTSVEVLDPATGEQRWQLPERARFLPGGPFLVQRDDNEHLLRSLDPRTGRTVAQLTGWQVLDLNQWLDALGRGTAPLLLSPTPGRDETRVGVFGRNGTAIPLAAVPHSLPHCETTAAVVACRTRDHQLRVWRVG